MIETALSLLKKHWGYDSFRAPQYQIIETAYGQKDTLVLLPTSGGKSLCYQLPALLLPGCCLVISPLIALIKDQVSSLLQKGIPAVGIYSGLSKTEVEIILKDVSHQKYKLLYVSPERLKSKLFQDYLAAMSISLIAVDEAHCVSQWGYDFRPAYLDIKNIRKELPNIPLMALSATATSGIIDDIKANLSLREPLCFIEPILRPQLSFSVFEVDSKINKLVHILESVQGASLVYCNNRRKCAEVAHLLKFYNTPATYYHAGLSQQERTQRQDAWMSGNTRVMVCTSAFGMGIDKPDVRTVIHYDPPDCFENYYQEAGRAGRDGKRSYAVLLLNHTDKADMINKAADKYPAIQEIKKVYQSIADYLQIPIGIGAEQYFPFDISDFTKKFKVSSVLTMNVLRILGQEGILCFEEDIFIPSMVIVSAPRESLEDIEKTYPDIEQTLKALLRIYEGIADDEVAIYEKQVAKFLRRDLDFVHSQLQLLKKRQIIKYTAHRATPQLYFFSNRASAAHLSLHAENYLFRKNLYEGRLYHFIRYIEDQNTCRAVSIANYFNPQKIQNCGICDTCSGKKNNTIQPDDVEALKQRMQIQLSNQEIHIATLVKIFEDIPKQKFWNVFHYLEAEKMIRIDKYGKVCWHK